MSPSVNARNPSIGVVGLGNWGTALANHLAMKGFEVLGWAIEPDIVSSINQLHRNPRYLSHATLSTRVRATLELSEILVRDVVVVAVPSSVLGTVASNLRFSPHSIVVSAIKGLEGGRLRTPLQLIEEECPPVAGLAVLSGPSFAKDIVVQRPSGVVAASKSEETAHRVADLFSSEWMKVYMSSDPLGVELGGIVKNVIALAAGVCDGLQLGDSARAGLITRGLAEMMRLAQSMGADIRTLSGLSGLGDLVMTATCDSSRNRTVGLELGRGKKLPQIIAELGSVAEAVETTPHVLELAKRQGVEMPITFNVARLLAGEVNAPELVKQLITRPMRKEID